MNSLKIKLLGITILITIATVAAATWHNMRTQDLMVEQLATQNGRIIAQAIHNSIVTAMQSGRNEEVIDILRKIDSEPTISSPRIFDETGRILISTNPHEVGQTVAVFDLNTFHTNPDGFSQSSKDGTSYTFTLPINNQPKCHGCHGDQEDLLGIFNVNLYLCSLQTIKTEGEKANLASSLSLLMILIASLVSFVLYYVDTPIRKMTAAMTELEQGNFTDAKASVNNSREMSLLAEKYNRMVDHVKNLLDSTVRF